MSLKTEYIDAHGTTVEAATEFCRDLMRGDAAKLKAGYTADNALIAAIEILGLTEAEATTVAGIVGADAALCLKAAR